MFTKVKGVVVTFAPVQEENERGGTSSGAVVWLSFQTQYHESKYIIEYNMKYKIIT
jgi:hypothetical protein